MRPETGRFIGNAAEFTRRHVPKISSAIVGLAAVGAMGYVVLDSNRSVSSTNQKLNAISQEMGLSREDLDSARTIIPGISKQIDLALRQGQTSEEILAILNDPNNQRAIDINSQQGPLPGTYTYLSTRTLRDTLLLFGGGTAIVTLLSFHFGRGVRRLMEKLINILPI